MWWQGFGEGRLGTLLSILLVWLGGEVMPPFGPVFVGGGGGVIPLLCPPKQSSGLKREWSFRPTPPANPHSQSCGISKVEEERSTHIHWYGWGKTEDKY